MEYQQKKQEILEKVQYHNLLSFSLVQNKLQRNFRSIVDALLLNQTHQVGLRDDLNQLQQKTTNDHNNLQQKIQALQKAIQNIQNQPNNQQTIMSQHNTDSNSNKEILKSIKNFPEENKQTKGQIEKLKDEIDKIKSKLTDGNYLQNLIANMQKDISQIKGELATIGQNRPSIKELKRSSVIKEVSNSLIENQPPSKINQIKNRASIRNSKNNINNQNNEQDHTKQDDADLADKIDKEFNSLYIELNTLKLGYEELRENCLGLNKKQMKQSNNIDELKENLKKLEKQSINDNQNYEKQFKNLHLEIINLQNVQRTDCESSQTKQVGNNGKVNSTKQFQNVNFKNQLNDRFSKLQAMIQACISQAEFNRFKKQTRDKFDNLDANNNLLKENMQEQFRKVYELIDNKGYEIENTKKGLDQVKDLIEEKNSQLQRKNNICLSKIEQLKKNLQNLRQDMEFYQSMQIQTSQLGEKTINNQNLSVQEDKNGKKEENQNGHNNKSLEQLKKSLTNKIQDQRIHLLGLIRDLQRRLTPKGSVEQDIVSILDKISEINLFLGKKADQQDTKKSLAYLQKKLGMLASNFMSNQDNTQDARVARTNWFCLSCDKNLHNYAGKVGRHVVWDTLPMRANGSKFIVKDQKKPLPVLKR